MYTIYYRGDVDLVQEDEGGSPPQSPHVFGPSFSGFLSYHRTRVSRKERRSCVDSGTVASHVACIEASNKRVVNRKIRLFYRKFDRLTEVWADRCAIVGIIGLVWCSLTVELVFRDIVIQDDGWLVNFLFGCGTVLTICSIVCVVVYYKTVHRFHFVTLQETCSPSVWSLLITHPNKYLWLELLITIVHPFAGQRQILGISFGRLSAWMMARWYLIVRPLRNRSTIYRRRAILLTEGPAEADFIDFNWRLVMRKYFASNTMVIVPSLFIVLIFFGAFLVMVSERDAQEVFGSYPVCVCSLCGVLHAPCVGMVYNRHHQYRWLCMCPRC